MYCRSLGSSSIALSLKYAIKLNPLSGWYNRGKKLVVAAELLFLLFTEGSVTMDRRSPTVIEVELGKKAAKDAGANCEVSDNA